MQLAPPPALPRHDGHPHQAIAPILPMASATGEFQFHAVSWQTDGFGFDATSGEFFTASPVALLVMQALGDGLSRGQILDRITAAYDVTRRTVERDLESFLAELEHLGLSKS